MGGEAVSGGTGGDGDKGEEPSRGEQGAGGEPGADGLFGAGVEVAAKDAEKAGQGVAVVWGEVAGEFAGDAEEGEERDRPEEGLEDAAGRYGEIAGRWRGLGG